jgi:hypothetical protein
MQWVPYFLTDELKATRIATSTKTLEILAQQEQKYFTGIIREDESWFLLDYSRNRGSRLGTENAQERISQTIDTEKHMFTIFWSTTGPLVEDWLPTNASFNSTYFCEVIVPRLASAAFSDQAGQRKRRFYLYRNHTRPQNSRNPLRCVADNKSKRMPHPPYSQDIVPRNFYLFSTVKQRLQTCEGGSFEALQENVHEILNSIARDELGATMRASMEGLRRVIATGGHCV